MIFGLPIESFLVLFGLPICVIGVMFYYCWRIASGRDD
jgi:hypothetical protein